MANYVKVLLCFWMIFCCSCFTLEDRDHCSNSTKIVMSYVFNQTPLPDSFDFVQKLVFYTGSNMNELGNYEDCVRMENGKYFLMNVINPAFPIQIGFCYFNTCTFEILNSLKSNITAIVNALSRQNMSSDAVYISDPHQENKSMREKYFVSFVISIVVLCLLALMPILNCIFNNENSEHNAETKVHIHESTELVSHSSEKLEEKSSFQKFLQHFDIVKNLDKIVTVDDEKNEHKKLRVLDGARFLAIFMVVVGHSFFTLLLVRIKNIQDLPDFIKSLHGAVLTTYLFSVDLFFFLSGFLFCVNIQKYLGKEGISKMSIIWNGCLLRYIRLLPLYLFCMTILMNLTPYISDGPLYGALDTLVDNCHKNWWLNLLYISNFIKSEQMEMCIPHSWYLANDFQFFLVSIIIYILLSNNKTLRRILLGAIFFGSFVLTFVICYVYDIQYLGTTSPNYWNVYYVKPWCRLTPYFLGIYFAELYLNVDREDVINDEKPSDDKLLQTINRKLKKSAALTPLLAILSLSCIIYTIFIHYQVALVEGGVSILASAFYYTFNKAIYILGFGTLLHLTYLDKLTLLRDILSLKIFTVFGRVTFGVYLIHLILMFVYFFGFPSSMYLRFSDFLFIGFGFLSITIPISLVVSALVESPVINMIKGSDKRGKK